jgi:hypothetical protein
MGVVNAHTYVCTHPFLGGSVGWREGEKASGGGWVRRGERWRAKDRSGGKVGERERRERSGEERRKCCQRVANVLLTCY